MSTFRYTINGNTYDVSIDSFQGSAARVTVNGITYDIQIEREKPTPPKLVRPKVVAGEGPQPARMKPQAGLGAVKAPLPGVVKSIAVKPGEVVKQGQAILILEAMKMDNEIYAPLDGTVNEIHVTAGQAVLEGDVLVTIGG
ncbi:MAG: biotin/lipoyl-binding protein [Acidobacteriota bacterium]|jgi:biotin carboxyl carrier protein